MSEDQVIIFIPIFAFVVFFLAHRFHRGLYRRSLEKENPFSYYRKFILGPDRQGYFSPLATYVMLTIPFWMSVFDPKSFPKIAAFEFDSIWEFLFSSTMTLVGFVFMFSYTYYFMKAEKECIPEEKAEPFYKFRVYFGLGIWFLAIPIFFVVRWMSG